MKNSSSILLITALVVVLFHGCKKSEDVPTLPPSKSMSIDFSNFTGKKSANIDLQTTGTATSTNINLFLAKTTAGFWNIILTTNLFIPVAVFDKAIQSTPVSIGDKKWEWKYIAPVGTATYNARLTGQIQSTDIKWEMYISKTGDGAFDEFMWFSGTSDLDGKSGQWILNYSPLFKEPLLQIDWILNGTNIGSITYTYIRDLKDNRTADLFKTSFIEYGLTTNSLNGYYTVHFNNSTTTADFKNVYIEWNTNAHNGHIKALHYYQDSNWHCWDGTGADIVCNF
jgi:hypothetical protein